MKLYKFIALSLAVSILSLLGCGCATSDTTPEGSEYLVLEVGSFDNLDGGKHVSEYSIWSPEKLNYHQDASADQHVTVSFNGVSYSGTYQRTSIRIPNTHLTHRYKAQNVYFEINAVTGQLSNISFVYEPAQQATLNESECKQIADHIADDYITLDDYKVDTYIQQIYSNAVYSFTYYREVNGYRTSDSLTIAIDGNGNISSFGMSMLGAFHTTSNVAYDSEKAQRAIQTKLNTIYTRKDTQKSHQIRKIMLIKLEDGTDAYLYTIDNQVGDISSQVQLLLKP